MVGGIFTKISLGLGFMAIIFVFGLGFMTQMGNEYGVSMEPAFQNNFEIQDGYVDISLESAEILEGGSIDQKTSDIAQLTGGLSSQTNQMSNYRLLKQSLEDLIRIFPYDPAFNVILLGILTTVFASGIIYLLFGRKG